jgi:3-methyladenine DNA glycosylase AlkD
MFLTADNLKQELRQAGTMERAETCAWFFKTGKGQYAEGDKFLGVNVPSQRKLAKKYLSLPLSEIKLLVDSPYHEDRLTGLIILTLQYPKADLKKQKEIYNFYLKYTKSINNWDLVDLSAPNIVGNFLLNKDREVLCRLASSKNLWEKRIAIVSTFAFIRNKEAEYTFKISEILLNDDHDLIHKAVGWMLREVGKRCGREVEEKFLKIHYQKMPRTMLRYAIEHFEEEKRQKYLKGKIS